MQTAINLVSNQNSQGSNAGILELSESALPQLPNMSRQISQYASKFDL